MISPSSMLNKGTKPPNAVNESCMELTAPHDASVVTIAKQQEGDDADDDIFHNWLLEFFAEANVKSGDDEEQDDDSDEEQVTHNGPPGQAQESGVASDLRSSENTFVSNPPRGGAADTSNPRNKIVRTQSRSFTAALCCGFEPGGNQNVACRR